MPRRFKSHPFSPGCDSEGKKRGRERKRFENNSNEIILFLRGNLISPHIAPDGSAWNTRRTLRWQTMMPPQVKAESSRWEVRITTWS